MMNKSFDAICVNGVLHPLEQVNLPEHARLHITVSAVADDEWLDVECHALAEKEADSNVSLQDARDGLASIRESMAEHVVAERNER